MTWRMQLLRRLHANLPVLVCVLLMAGVTRADAASASADGQQTVAGQTVTDVLQAMSGRAGVIFVGQVLAVRPLSETRGVVEVDFRVDTPIRGCTAGTYTLREWAGLWAAGEQRYRVGQRLLMLLHEPGAAGLSSPIDGLNGAIPIRHGTNSSPYTGVSAPVHIVDLRWLGAKLPRRLCYNPATSFPAQSLRLPPVPFVATPEAVLALPPGGSADLAVIGPVSGDASVRSVPAQQASVNAVVTMLTAWEAARHAVR